METLKSVEKDIKKFQDMMRDVTSWDTGKNILDYLDAPEALTYGRMLGKRDILEELSQKKGKRY